MLQLNSSLTYIQLTYNFSCSFFSTTTILSQPDASLININFSQKYTHHITVSQPLKNFLILLFAPVLTSYMCKIPYSSFKTLRTTPFPYCFRSCKPFKTYYSDMRLYISYNLQELRHIIHSQNFFSHLSSLIYYTTKQHGHANFPRHFTTFTSLGYPPTLSPLTLSLPTHLTHYSVTPFFAITT